LDRKPTPDPRRKGRIRASAARKTRRTPPGPGRRRSRDPIAESQPDPGGGSRLASAQQSIGSFLRAARTSQGLTQEQVAARTRRTPWRLSRAAISAIERGQNFPGMEAMLALSNVLYVDPKELIERARLSTAVPVDLTDLPLAELEQRAARFFWDGEFRKALAVYDAMLERLVLDPPQGGGAGEHAIAGTEIRRATTLKRAGALLSAIATVERAVAMTVDHPRLHAEAYIVLADLQCQRGHLPLAGDAARKAIELADSQDERLRGWAWMALAHVRYLAERFESARHAFLEARKHARLAGDELHLTHIEGDIGMCWLALGHDAEARKWVERAVDRARRQGQPALEASWRVELGKLAFKQGDPETARRQAAAALQIAEPLEHVLTVFRAQWLTYRVDRASQPAAADPVRLDLLRKLYLHLDQHEGVEEIQEFKKHVYRRRDEGREAKS
jgi:transcriptional regulator with XRE-family HTH domain